MYSVIRGASTRHLLTRQLPPLAIAFVIAELFYKFKSFTLECLAFLITWFVVDAIFWHIANAINPGQPTGEKGRDVS